MDFEKKDEENFEKMDNSKFSKKNFDAISSGNVDQSKFSEERREDSWERRSGGSWRGERRNEGPVSEGVESNRDSFQDNNRSSFIQEHRRETPLVMTSPNEFKPVKREEEILKERKEKLFKFIKSGQAWVIGVLIIALILGVYIRSLPMQDHGENPGLWDITTNTWTLGPDLDPWLFERYAKIIIEEGSLPAIDMMRNVPLGFDTSIESMLLPYMIDWTYHGLNFVGVDASVEYAAVIFPVIMFALTIITFFLFVREIFVRKGKDSILRANLIALISTFLMIVTPMLLARTVAGIPEKESAAFFFLFLVYYLFMKGWKSEKNFNAGVFGVLAGISTGLLGLIWGGVIYAFIPIGLAGLIAFVLNRIGKKEFMVYGLWVVISIATMLLFSNRYSLISMATSINSGFALLILAILVIDFVIWNTKISSIKFFRESKLPRAIVSLIVAIILIIILASVFMGPSFFIDKVKVIHQAIFKPVQGRWNITVAENRQPNFQEWSQSFGPFVKGIPLMFWLFFAGSVVLFRKMLLRIRKKDAWILTGLYVFFFFGIVFSRYSGSSVFNGDNFISKAFYYVSVTLLAVSFIYYYLEYYKRGEKGFERIRMEYLLLFSLFVLTLFTARGAVRLIMVLGPISAIFVGFLIIESIGLFRKAKDETLRIVLAVLVILILISSMYCFWVYYNSVSGQAYNFIPSAYNIQWQKAMNWVRDETPVDSVFAHWWDYGYWIQSIGERATVTDGGNAVVYWNYLMGRLVLTGDNQEDALEFLYNHNTTHLLIDSTDIGKYTAFSSIGSDEAYDRYSWIGIFILDESQTQETNNQTLLIYPGGTALDEDLIIENNGREILLPVGSAGVGAIIVPTENFEGGSKFGQPYVMIVYQGMQQKVNLRYLSINGEFFDFGSGIEAAAYIFPRLIPQGQGISKSDIGAAMFISPRLFRGMLAQIYILEDPLERYPNFKIAHVEPSLIVDDLRKQGMPISEFVYYNGIQGPIKIWDVEYTGEEEIKQEYLDTDATKYLDWRL